MFKEFKGIENLKVGQFTPTPEEEEKDPNIRKKMEAANKAKNRTPGEQARESLKRALEGDLEDGKKQPEEELEKAA